MNFVRDEILYIKDKETGAEMEVTFIQYLVVGCLVSVDFGITMKVPCTSLYRK